ncbi:MAG: hypothetical protein COU31_00245 [Candidatus Magasanikbacteria bacterium CG10_big_fil_rev_8_21_14_0_10_40_10]|uniref:Four helix bundle protein n=1 Tax=Candidatus Magasanikbacteria bacterium CG10_big_fil_rev_8_21_14_0_10_40_10 TaxID=1974648 RepID=A0A2M6W531_9BACT|nr:MAG: hypothetical protein COU31_00245 [Candidatus Magasanikbacteria bacterium CG10_big_fil_rev_8_21_14_0_10_40_10]
MAGYFHKNMAAGRWFTMSLSEQMGNVGSEVGRAVNWQKRGNIEQSNRATDRALELLDLTISDRRWKNRLTEIIRARHLVADLFYGANECRETPQNLEKYFYYFALLARKEK